MSAPLPVPPAGGDANRGPALLACIWTPFPFTVFLLGSRLYVRLKINGMGIDDYLMVISWILYTATFAVETVNILHDGTRHLYYLTPDQMEFALKLTWISQPVGIMASAFGKCSVAFLIQRIIGSQEKWIKWLLYSNTALYLGASIVSSILGYCQCKPADAIWAQVPGAKCWNPVIDADFDLFQSAYGAAFDFFLALLPGTIIWKLRLSVRKRIATCILLGLGVFAGICAAIKTATLRNPIAITDFTWATFDIWVWTSLEISLVIICGCIPTLRPLWDQVLHGKTITSYKNSNYPSRKQYAMRSATSDRFGTGKFNSLSNATTASEGSQVAPDDREMYPTANDIRVQQDVYVHTHDDTSPLRR